MVHEKAVFCTARKNVPKREEEGSYDDVALNDENETNNNNNNNLKAPVADSVLLSILSSMKKKPPLDDDSGLPPDDVKKEDEEVERGNWSNQIEFFLSCLAYAVGIGNVWRFPYKCYKNGGGVFLIPYLVMLFLAALPMFYMELALGQFSQLGPNKIFEATVSTLRQLVRN